MSPDTMQQALFDVVEKAKKYDNLVKLQGFHELQCSLCGKFQSEVKKLVAGKGIYICDECVDLCYKIIHEEEQQEETQ